MPTICGSIVQQEEHKWGLDDCGQLKLFFRRIDVDGEERKKRVQKAILLGTELTHPNISKPLGIHVDEKVQQAYAYSRLMEYGSASRLINECFSSGLSERAIGNIVAQLMPALKYLHDQGIIHRGVNASNILLDASGVARLGGFSHAVRISSCNRWIGVDSRIHSFDDHLQDVFVWLAPEIMKQDINGYGVESDIYSVGITVCELGNGFAPFSEMEPLQILYEKIRGSTPFLLDRTTTSPCDCDDNDGQPAEEKTVSILPPQLRPSSSARRLSSTATADDVDVTFRKKAAFTPTLHELVTQCMSYTWEDRPSCIQVMESAFLRPYCDMSTEAKAAELLELFETSSCRTLGLC